MAESQDRLLAVNTAIIASKFFTNHEVIYIDIKSKWTSINVFNINTKSLINAVLSNWSLVDRNLIELYFWIPKNKLFTYFSKIQLLFFSFAQQINLYKLKKMYSEEKHRTEILINEISSYKTHNIINARFVIPIENSKNLQNYIRDNCSSMVDSVKRDALKKTSILETKRLLPVKFVRVYVYHKYLRKRQIDFRPISSGLFSVIEWDNTELINPIEIFDKSQFETIGQYRLTWDEEQLL